MLATPTQETQDFFFFIETDVAIFRDCQRFDEVLCFVSREIGSSGNKNLFFYLRTICSQIASAIFANGIQAFQLSLFPRFLRLTHTCEL